MEVIRVKEKTIFSMFNKQRRFPSPFFKSYWRLTCNSQFLLSGPHKSERIRKKSISYIAKNLQKVKDLLSDTKMLHRLKYRPKTGLAMSIYSLKIDT
jgi:hypothetical protein